MVRGDRYVGRFKRTSEGAFQRKRFAVGSTHIGKIDSDLQSHMGEATLGKWPLSFCIKIRRCKAHEQLQGGFSAGGRCLHIAIV